MHYLKSVRGAVQVLRISLQVFPICITGFFAHFDFAVGRSLAGRSAVEYRPELLVVPPPPLKALHRAPSSFLQGSLVHQMEKLELPSGLPGDGGVKKEMGGGQEGGKGCFFRRI